MTAPLRDQKANVLRLVPPTGDDWFIGVRSDDPGGEFVRFRLTDLFTDHVADISDMEVRRGEGEDYRPLRTWLNEAGSGADGRSAYQVAVDNGFVGTSAQWLASLQGAAGPKGDPGAKGDQGIQGTKGDTGDQGIQGLQGVQGWSAYEVAVQNGFVGTVNEWLASLVGPKGDKGDPGDAASGVDWTAITNKPATFPPSAHTHALADLPVATSGTSSATQLVRADDTRLSNARAPTAHSHAIADLPVAASGTSSATQVVRADDSRLSDARAPTAHTHATSEITGLDTILRQASQRIRSNNGSNMALFSAGYYWDANQISFIVPVMPMRSIPTAAFSGAVNSDYGVVQGAAVQTGFTFSISQITERSIVVTASKTSHGLTVGPLTAFFIRNAGHIELTAP